MSYTGPIPPVPTATSTDAQWATWHAYQTCVTNGKWDDERAARQTITDRQHAEKMASEAACREAQLELAAAQRAMVNAFQEPTPTPVRLPTKAELVFAILRDHPQATILTNGQLVTGCKNIVDAYVAQFPGAVNG